MEVLREYVSNINIPYHSFILFYKGTHSISRIHDINGVSIDLPCSFLVPHLTQNGISGKFKITNESGKFEVLKIE